MPLTSTLAKELRMSNVDPEAINQVRRDEERLRELRARLHEREQGSSSYANDLVCQIYRRDIRHLVEMTQPFRKWHMIIGEWNV